LVEEKDNAKISHEEHKEGEKGFYPRAMRGFYDKITDKNL